jgi:hypothetical protein
MKNLLTFLIAILIATLMVTSSCKKLDTISSDELNIAQDDALADNTFTDIQSIGDQAYSNEASSKKSASAASDSSMLPPSAQITIDTANNKTITIDFGTGYTCSDGRTRKGKIIITFSGPYWKTGTMITHTTDGYEVDGYKVLGTKTVTNKGWSNYEPTVYPGGYIKYDIHVAGKIVKPAGDTIVWNSDRIRKWIYGYGILSYYKWRDDVYALSGTISGKRANGVTYTGEIKEDLVKPLIYPYIIKGSLEIVTSKGNTISINYGDGDWKKPLTWDNKATVTVNDISKEITLR